jgi:hypothetical protein
MENRSGSWGDVVEFFVLFIALCFVIAAFLDLLLIFQESEIHPD